MKDGTIFSFEILLSAQSCHFEYAYPLELTYINVTACSFNFSVVNSVNSWMTVAGSHLNSAHEFCSLFI